MKIFLLICFYFILSLVYTEENLGRVEVIGTSPLPGIMVEKDKHPSTSQSIGENKIKKNLSKSLVDLMNENFSGLTVKDVQNGSFQKNVDYRGFTASPLLGESQGITV